MCGIAGLLSPEGRLETDEWRTALASMSARMKRRGPDDEGVFIDPSGKVGLAFRRLSILDPTPLGHQPMVSSSGDSLLVFNGEIYGFNELRNDLIADGASLRSTSDSEVLLEALERRGESLLPELDGMFAFAWYKRREQKVVLVRDRCGIKPLYWRRGPRGALAFASQYNSLFDCPWAVPELRRDVLSLYLRLNYVPAPFALHEECGQLEPGEVVELSLHGEVSRRRYWTFPERTGGIEESEPARELIENALSRSIEKQRIADFPVGAFLSSGVDSSLVCSLLAPHLDESLPAFTLANPGWGQDEAHGASGVAQALRLDHRVLSVSGTEALAGLDEMIASLHEPFADFSLLPTFLISRFARLDVKVALSGDGGDELFFGYERPFSLRRDGFAFRYPHLVRQLIWGMGRLGVGRRRSDAILARSPGDYYFGVNSRFPLAELTALGLDRMPHDFDLYRSPKETDLESLMHFSRRVEIEGQLGRCLKKVDMASMHASLEVRVPFLGNDVVDAALAISPAGCMPGGRRKGLLRGLLVDRLAGRAELVDDRKLGFSVPLSRWLREELRERAEGSLFGAAARQLDLDGGVLRGLWQKHQTGERDLKWPLWGLLCLVWWQEARTGSRPEVPAVPELSHQVDEVLV